MQRSFSFIKDGGWLTMTLAVLVSVFFVVMAVEAAATISTNVNAGGTLTVSGHSSLATASSTITSQTGNFMVNGFATTTASNGNIATAGTLTVTGASTLTGAQTLTGLTTNVAGFVSQASSTVVGAFTVTGAASSSITSQTGNFMVNGYATTTASNGNIATEGTLNAKGSVTLGDAVTDSTTANAYFTFLRIGTGNTFDILATVDADELGVEGAVEFDSTFNVAATSTMATTTIANLLTVGTTTPWQTNAEVIVDGSGTTTLWLTSSSAAAGGCIQMENALGVPSRIWISGTSTIMVQVGSCK